VEVKAKISETEAEIKEVSEAIKKLGVPLSSEDKDTLAYLRQKESNLSQEKKDLRQKENNLRQEKARLEALAASTGSKASADPGKTSARGYECDINKGFDFISHLLQGSSPSTRE
jgi:chromosome segregation ATPase